MLVSNTGAHFPLHRVYHDVLYINHLDRGAVLSVPAMEVVVVETAMSTSRYLCASTVTMLYFFSLVSMVCHFLIVELATCARLRVIKY